jgi:chromosome segregation ATPase
MIEAVMYMIIGFLLGCLLGIAVMPLIRDRAVRLTMRKVEAALPMSMGEIEIQKDLMRADFAMAVRRLELRIERLNERRARLESELSKKNALFNWIRAQRDALNTEVVDLRTQIDALRKQVPPARPRIDAGAYVVRQMVPRRSLRASR